MRSRPTAFAGATSTLSVTDLAQLVEGWILDGEIRQYSPRTTEARRDVTGKLLWFLERERARECGPAELRRFLGYLTRGHEDPAGRWGDPRLTRAVKPATVSLYYRNLHALFAWLVEEGELEASPMAQIRPPVVRWDQIQPFSLDQVEALLAATRKGLLAARDEAILLFLVDTGARASELCALSVADVDWSGRKCRVLGKGAKARTLPYGLRTARALHQYARRRILEPGEPLFLSESSVSAGGRLTLNALEQMVERTAKRAGVTGVRCSPHTFRHTFAVEFLRAGGNVFSLKMLLGHESLAIVNRYVALAQADIEAQHRLYSPADRLRRR